MSTPVTFISRSTINELPILKYFGPIELVNTSEQLPEVLEALNTESILGFDTETRPSFKKGISYLPSLLQLATQATVYIFQLKKLSDISGLFEVLSNPLIKKVGVAVLDDIKGLQALQPFTDSNFIDISALGSSLGIARVGLRSLAALLLNQRIAKGFRTSNWASATLSPQQIQYAATDAWVSRELYLKLLDLQIATITSQTLIHKH